MGPDNTQAAARPYRVTTATSRCCLFWMRSVAHWAIIEGRPAAAEQAVDRICMRHYYALATTSRINRVSRRRQLQYESCFFRKDG